MDSRAPDGNGGKPEASGAAHGGSPNGIAPADLKSHPPKPHLTRNTLLKSPHSYRGRLIAVEGIDGSGKSTQLGLLERWLRAHGYPVHFTQWNSSRLVRRSMQRGKRKNLLTPTTFSLLHAVDFADRLTYQILPPLKAGMIVLADRYVYTAFARDVARGVHPEWVRQVYAFAPRPDLTIYFRVPIEVSLERLLAAGPSSSITKPGWTWDSPRTRLRVSASSRAACSKSTTRSATSSDCTPSKRPAIFPRSSGSCGG